MPSFGAQERVRIETELRRTAARLFAAQGLRKTTLDELVASAGIVKSSFYAFFDSKESLYLDLMLGQIDDVRARLPALSTPGTNPAGDLRALLRQIVDVLETDPLYRRLISNPDDMARVASKLGHERAAEVHHRLVAPLLDLIERGQHHGGLVAADARVVLGVLQAVLLVPVHAAEFGQQLYRLVLDLLIDSVVTGLTSATHPPADDPAAADATNREPR